MIVEKAKELEQVLQKFKREGVFSKDELQRAVFDLYAAVYSATAEYHWIVGTPEKMVIAGAQDFLHEAILHFFPSLLDDKQKEGDVQE